MSKVLVIDNDKRVYNFIVNSFKTAQLNDIQFLYGESAQEAEVSLAQNPDIDLVITGLKLPDITGITLAARLQKHTHDLPVVLFTAYNDPAIILEAHKLGIDFWYKPEMLANPEHLVAVIDTEVKKLNGHAGKPKFSSTLNLKLQSIS